MKSTFRGGSSDRSSSSTCARRVFLRGVFIQFLFICARRMCFFWGVWCFVVSMLLCVVFFSLPRSRHGVCNYKSACHPCVIEKHTCLSWICTLMASCRGR